MQFATFRYFLAVAENRSIRKTADQLHISSSAISRQIQNLEHSFGCELFERRPSGVYLTAEGLAVEKHLRRSLDDINLAREQIDALHQLVRGHISFATIEGVVPAWLSPAIRSFRERYPGITFEGVVAGAETVYETVMAYQVDFGIAMHEEELTGVENIVRFHTPFKVAAAVEHELAGHDEVDLFTLSRFPLALLGRHFYTGDLLNRVVRQRGLQANIVLQLNHIDMLKRFVRESDMVTILPDFALANEALSGSMTVVPVSEKDMPPAVTLLYVRQERRLSSAARMFLRHLAEMRGAMGIDGYFRGLLAPGHS